MGVDRDLLSASVFTPILGRIGDMAGRGAAAGRYPRRLAAGSILAGLAHSIIVLIVARVIQGVGGAVIPL